MITDAAYTYAEEQLKDYRTACCKVRLYKKGRADLRCSKCDADITLEIVLLSQMLALEYDDSKNCNVAMASVNARKKKLKA